MVKFFPSRKAFLISYVATGLSCGLAIVSYVYDFEFGIILAIIGAKIGISNAFNYIYFSTVEYFPTAFLGLVMGVTNVSGRSATIAAPLVAELARPIPMVSCIVLCAVSIIAALVLKEKEEDAEEKKAEVQMEEKNSKI
mmetsp:Transcript_17767/g.27477  ORF Transcript_17767/g.27477 Transcript_17767/m.27477 type:complete len:139 (+) Transcript_17767:1498-1914(+)